MPNYQNSKIYKLVCNTNNLTYYGSTTQPLNKRLHQHKDKIKRKIKSCKNFDPNNIQIFLVENFKCDNKEQLIKKEREYIEKYECVNLSIPGRKMKEYYQDNKEHIKNKVSKWVKNNKERIQKNNMYIVCECGKEIKKYEMPRHKKSKKHLEKVVKIVA